MEASTNQAVFQDVMVDIETLGNGSKAVITSIGAVLFNGDGLGHTFYSRVCPQSCVDVGLELDVSTIIWWLKQSDAARAEFQGASRPLQEVLADFAIFLPQGVRVWGNGATFDNVIVGNAYKACGLHQPWGFWNDRCYRTIKNQYPNVPIGRTGTHHHALEDAKSQALHLLLIGCPLL